MRVLLFDTSVFKSLSVLEGFEWKQKPESRIRGRVFAIIFNIYNDSLSIATRDAIGRIPSNQKLLNDLLEMQNDLRLLMSHEYIRQIYLDGQRKRRQEMLGGANENEVSCFCLLLYLLEY